MCELLGLDPCVAFGHNVFAQPDTFAFVGHDLAASHDQVERSPFADQTGKPDRAAVDQRDTPPSAVHTHISGLFHHPDVGPHSQLHAARHSRPSHGGDDWFR